MRLRVGSFGVLGLFLGLAVVFLIAVSASFTYAIGLDGIPNSLSCFKVKDLGAGSDSIAFTFSIAEIQDGCAPGAFELKAKFRCVPTDMEISNGSDDDQCPAVDQNNAFICYKVKGCPKFAATSQPNTRDMFQPEGRTVETGALKWFCVPEQSAPECPAP